MKPYFTRLALWAGSLLMVLAANLIARFAALIGSSRAWPITVANDQAQ